MSLAAKKIYSYYLPVSACILSAAVFFLWMSGQAQLSFKTVLLLPVCFFLSAWLVRRHYYTLKAEDVYGLRFASAFDAFMKIFDWSRNPEFSPFGGKASDEEDEGLFEYPAMKKYGRYLMKKGLVSGATVYCNRVQTDRYGVEVLPLGYLEVEQIVSEILTCEVPLVKAKGRIPVLFVHGYNSSVLGLGGGKDTWGNLPYMLKNDRFVMAEFRWRTGQKFQEAAKSLAEATAILYRETGHKVRYVAHSFGGLLVRTYVQGLADGAPFAHDADSLIAFGTPNSGISSDVCFRFGTALPKGQVFDMSMTGQISGYQAGQEIEDLRSSKEYGTEDEPGFIPAKLSNFTKYPIPDGFRILSAIGLTNKNMTDETEDGDRVISYAGQRFTPSLTLKGIHPLLKDCTDFGGSVSEVVMGANGNDVRPGGHFLFHPDIYGYVHSPLIGQYKASQVYVKCVDKHACNHPAFILAKEWLKR